MNTSQKDRYGRLICSTTELPPKSVPSWGMYLVSAVCILLAGAFVIIAVDVLMRRGQGTIPVASASLLFVLIFLACGWGAFTSGRMTSKARQVRIHSVGVVIESSGGETFFPYADAEEITIELIEPSETTKGNAMARAALGLAVGHVAGIGRAIAESSSTGVVHLKLPGEKNPFVFQFDLETTKQIAEVVSAVCEHAVIHRRD